MLLQYPHICDGEIDGVDAEDFAVFAKEEYDVVVMPVVSKHPLPQHHTCQHGLRLCFAFLDLEEVQEGANRLLQAAQAYQRTDLQPQPPSSPTQ